jgi:hypothetical protein
MNWTPAFAGVTVRKMTDGFDVDDLIRRKEALVGDFGVEHTGLLLVMPVTQVRGCGKVNKSSSR